MACELVEPVLVGFGRLVAVEVHHDIDTVGVVNEPELGPDCVGLPAERADGQPVASSNSIVPPGTPGRP